MHTAQPTGTEESANAHLLTHQIPSSRDSTVGLQPHGGEQPHGGIDNDGKSRPTTGRKAGTDPGHWLKDMWIFSAQGKKGGFEFSQKTYLKHVQGKECSVWGGGCKSIPPQLSLGFHHSHQAPPGKGSLGSQDPVQILQLHGMAEVLKKYREMPFKNVPGYAGLNYTPKE